MNKRQFQAESKRILELMVNSIYTHREIFLRELISNASDAIDKIYYVALTDENLSFDRENYFIRIVPDAANRTLTVADSGIGMTQEELEANLGIIAKSGTLSFKEAIEKQEGYDIIGQFGVGFYSAFMVADKVTVISRALGSVEAYKWESGGSDGYTIEPWHKDSIGTDIILHLKESGEEEDYDDFLNQYRLQSIVKKYSDFIRYPIKMEVSHRRLKEGSQDEYEDHLEEKVINSMVPIWRKNKNELQAEDYENFYTEKHYGFDEPIKHIHLSVSGVVSYNAILFIPERIPFDFYSKDYEKGLELYANGVLIMNKCPDLLPDYFSFVKGLVDSEDLSLNISREMLQHDRQLKLIAKNINSKIKSELQNMLQNEREKYEEFFKVFGRQLKYGIYDNYGRDKEVLEDLLLFYSSREKRLCTLEEYVERMPEEQKYIYYAAGESLDRLGKMPQTELVADKGYEILFFTEDVDEFAIKILMKYRDKEFRSVSSGDLGIEQSDAVQEVEESHKSLFTAMQEILGGKVKEVRASRRLKQHPVCLTNEGELSIEMEKILNAMPDARDIKADKILEINVDHEIFRSLDSALVQDSEKLRLYTELLYNQARLIEGLPLDDPVEFSNNICKLML